MIPPSMHRALPCTHLVAEAGPSGEPRCLRGHVPSSDWCISCADYAIRDSERTRCEVWTRFMRYHSPVEACNLGNQSGHRERTVFREPPMGDDGPDDGGVA